MSQKKHENEFPVDLSWMDDEDDQGDFSGFPGLPKGFRKGSDEEKGRLGALLQAAQYEEDGSVPDLYGCEEFYILSMLEDPYSQFQDDFELIAKDFLSHRYGQLEQYKKRLFTEDPAEYLDLEFAWKVKIMYLMVEASNQNDAYTRDLLIHLYSLYCRKEYRALRKFHRISIDDVRALSDEYDDNYFVLATARILFMARLLGIEIDPSCNLLYVLLNKAQKEREKRTETDFPKYPENAYAEAGEILNTVYPNTRSMDRSFRMVNRYLKQSIKDEGRPDTYFEITDLTEDAERSYLQHAVKLLHFTFPNEKIPGGRLNQQTLPLYAIIGRLLESTSENISIFDESIDQAMGLDDGEFYDNFPPKFKPMEEKPEWDNTPAPASASSLTGTTSTQSASTSANKTSGKASGKISAQVPGKISGGQPQAAASRITAANPSATTTNTTDSTAASSYQDDLISQIRDLQARLHQEEGRSAHFRDLYKKEQKRTEEYDSLQGELRAEHEELTALRDHLYHLTEYDEDVAEEDLKAMKDAVKNLRIIIVGGNDNWVKKLRNECPGWSFISPNVSNSINARMVEKADHVYLFTDTLGHTNYYKFMNAIREAGVPFGYMHGVNIQKNIRQVYSETVGTEAHS